MMYKRLTGQPFGAVRIEGDQAIRLNDGSIVQSYEDGFDTSGEPECYECVTRPDGRIEWYLVDFRV